MRQFARFFLVGIANTVLGYGVIFGCMYLAGLPPEVSNVAGYMSGLCISYFLNRNFTFRSSGRVRTEISRFGSVFLVSYMANLILLILLVRLLHMDAAVSQIIAGFVYIVSSYLLNKIYVFRKN